MVLKRVLDVAPHYLAMFILVWLTLSTLRRYAPGLPIWIELIVVVILSIAYIALVTVAGIAPDSWEQSRPNPDELSSSDGTGENSSSDTVDEHDSSSTDESVDVADTNE